MSAGVASAEGKPAGAPCLPSHLIFPCQHRPEKALLVLLLFYLSFFSPAAGAAAAAAAPTYGGGGCGLPAGAPFLPFLAGAPTILQFFIFVFIFFQAAKRQALQRIHISRCCEKKKGGAEHEQGEPPTLVYEALSYSCMKP